VRPPPPVRHDTRKIQDAPCDARHANFWRNHYCCRCVEPACVGTILAASHSVAESLLFLDAQSD